MTKVLADFTSEASMRRGELAKARCENAGLRLLKTVRVGLDKFLLIYGKPSERLGGCSGKRKENK